VHKYVIMGIQGSGKGTQAALLARDLDLTQIGVGEMFRWHVQNHTKIGAHVRRTMTSGELVGDDLVESMVNERLQQHDWNFGFILDGFPRNARQAEFFLESYDIDGVMHLELADEEVRRRVLSRRLCSGCGMDYNVIGHRPEKPDTCDVCGGTLVARADDTEEALAARLRDWHEKTDPILALLRRKERVVSVDASASVATVQQAIRSALDLPDFSE
jgi:adenylate kinase